MTKPSLAVKDLSVTREGRRLLKNITAQLPSGQMTGIIGPNGAGKSTLLKTMVGLYAPDTGTVTLNGTPLQRFTPNNRAKIMGYMAQETTSQWPLTVRALVTLGRYPHRRLMRTPAAADINAIAAALDCCHLTPLAERSVMTLSGGERARVMLARVLAGEPQILLADEPTADLDPRHQIEVMETLKSRTEAGGIVGVVLHDLNLAARFCDHLILLQNGEIIAQGPRDTVLRQEILKAAYGVETLIGHHDETPYVIPLQVSHS